MQSSDAQSLLTGHNHQDPAFQTKLINFPGSSVVPLASLRTSGSNLNCVPHFDPHNPLKETLKGDGLICNS